MTVMVKIVNKLPLDDQKRYDEYMTSDTVFADPSPEWDKFWTWLEKLQKLAVQGNLRNMCTKSDSGTGKSGVTCNSCGGLGHFARVCPSRSSKPSSNVPVKVNMAVTKITTKDEYKLHLPETRKQIGCPFPLACKIV